MPTKQFRDLLAKAGHYRFASERALDAFLDEQRIVDPTERIAAKHAIEAGGLATDQGPHRGLATDTQTAPYIARIMPEIEGLMRKARIEPGRRYREAEVDDLLSEAGLSAEERISIKTEMLGRNTLLV